jgi:hypothetical protein
LTPVLAISNFSALSPLRAYNRKNLKSNIGKQYEVKKEWDQIFILGKVYFYNLGNSLITLLSVVI